LEEHAIRSPPLHQCGLLVFLGWAGSLSHFFTFPRETVQFSCEPKRQTMNKKKEDVDMTLQGKIAVVTGGGRGIGRAIAIRLAKEGALVVVNYQKNGEAAAVAVREIEAAGGEAFSLQGDVGSVEQICRFFQSLDIELTKRRDSNQFDILVNNAGIFTTGNVETLTEVDFDRTFSVDVKGPFYTCQEAIPRLRDGGRIVNISSAVTQHPSPQYAAYSMAKAAVNSLTVVLAAELGKRGITANTVAPGLTATDMTAAIRQDEKAVQSFNTQTALGRIGMAEDIAAVVAFVVSSDAGWVTGQYIEASGGLRLV
jgi:NAD(P)-dependent dehydrogenase (short-subunit alcohol dehydrogenase family)